MKTALLLGLLLAGTLALPAADAHFVFGYPDPLTGDCLVIELPGPHGAGGIVPCNEVAHRSTLP